MDTTTIIIIAIFSIAIIVSAIVILRKILANPFVYPYFRQSFDVSKKRNVDIKNYIDEFLSDKTNWIFLQTHEENIRYWKENARRIVHHSPLKRLRERQLYEVEDDMHAYRFQALRNQKRYTQSNYLRSSYDVAVPSSVFAVSWVWLADRHSQLQKIGYETTLKDYHSTNQRRLMTRALREQIMKRDHYTCQFCGKYMPDEIGLQIDHIVPVSKGGKSVPSNLRVLCSKCNASKGSKYSDLWT